MSINQAQASFFLDLKNQLFNKCQNSKLAGFIADSLFFENIDNICYLAFLATIISTAFLGSGMIGLCAIVFSVLCFFKLIFKKGETFQMSKLDAILVIYFLLVIVSLFGSSLFVLSLKGFSKTIIYGAFYFFASYFFINNKKKILPTIFVIAAIMSFESIVGIFQNYCKVEAIAGWQDTSNLSDSTEALSRSYGTLQPYNPNLLAGYLIAGLSSFFALLGVNFAKKNIKRSIVIGAFLLISLLAIILTGCRGAYLGLMAYIGLLAWGFVYYVNRYLGGFSALKKRYKNALIGFGLGGLAFIFLNPAIFKRILSIFAFRQDSSISFRMNVYEASFKMFLDNPILGIGVGNKNFREIYGLYMRTGYDALGTYCVPLEIAVESGIFALLAFSALIFFAIKYGISFIKDERSSVEARVIVFSIILTIAAVMAHGLFDTVWYRPQLQIIFWTNLAFLNAYILSNRLVLVKK